MWSSASWTFEFSLKDDVMDGGWYPESAINGVIFAAVWKEVLYHHSERGNPWPVVFFYQIQNKEDILPNIYLLSQFDHQIEDDKMSYELIEYPNKKITLSKNFQ